MSPDEHAVDAPEYRRLAAHLRKGIEEQRWREGDPLPTDAELGMQFDVSRQTVRRAYLDLVNEGLVYRAPGRGTFLVPSHLRYRRPFETVDDLLGLSHDTEMETVEPLAGTYDPEAAARLQLNRRVMYGMRFLRRHANALLCHTSVYLPPEPGALLEDITAFSAVGETSTKTVVGVLEAKGLRIAGAEQSMTARAARPYDVELLGCPEGHPLLHVERLYMDDRGHPVELAVSAFLPENYTHRLRLGRRP